MVPGGRFSPGRIHAVGSKDIYAQRVDASGAVQWSTDGVPVCTEANDQQSPNLVSDGAGGVIVTWHDVRGSLAEIYSQRLNGSGVPQWTPGGVLISAAGGATEEILPNIVSDGAGGAIVIWNNGFLRAQRINASGVTLWPSGGVAVTPTSSAGQGANAALPNGTGGVLVAFTDTRNGANDIYAQSLDSNGFLPTGVGDAPLSPSFTLSPNWPNPFSTRTSLTLDLPVGSDVAVFVADVSGRIVRRMGLGYRSAGPTTLSFDGRDDRGQLLPHGVYFYCVRARGTTLTHKVEII
jgi:hypothetical protein